MEAAQRKPFPIARSEALIRDAKVHIVMGAIGEYAAAHLRKQLAQVLVVGTGDNDSVERHQIHERYEGLLHVAKIAVAVHVLAIDVGNDLNDWGEPKERAIAFVGLGDQVS